MKKFVLLGIVLAFIISLGFTSCKEDGHCKDAPESLDDLSVELCDREAYCKGEENNQTYIDECLADPEIDEIHESFVETGCECEGKLLFKCFLDLSCVDYLKVCCSDEDGTPEDCEDEFLDFVACTGMEPDKK
ncbi:hypothetical protein ACFL20_04070 [Spirochaetota bacterium]